MRHPITAASAAALLLVGSMPVYAGLLGDLLDKATPQEQDSAEAAPTTDSSADTGVLGGLVDGLTQKPQSDSEAAATRDGEDPTRVGTFSTPFAEPTIVVDGKAVATDERCLPNAEGSLNCKPAAGTLAVLGGGRFLYLNALEGTENVELSIVAEFGEVSVNDQSRVLTLGDGDTPSWAKPTPNDAGANPDGNDSTTLAGALPGIPDGALDTADNTAKNDGALFCADVVFLADGSVMAVGGTDYYTEPGVDGLPVGVVELEGLKNSRIFNPDDNTWTQSGDMNYGRWYPSLVTLADGDVFVASGVTKLLKPVYPENPLNSGRNVTQTETYDLDTGTWTDNGTAAERSLPLFPRMHLLPNGQVYYNAGGQAFNPFGQAYDQALWNIIGAYDPQTQTWTDLGYAGLPLEFNQLGLSALSTTLNPTNVNPEQTQRLLGDLVGQTLTNPTGAIEGLLDTPVDGRALERTIGSGMRGSTFSAMLPLRPDANGGYHDAQFLTAGGVPTYVTVGSPGGYLPISSSRIDTVTVNGDDMEYSSRLTAPLNEPRWYSYSVVMPDDGVMIFSGGNRDGVVVPGLEGAYRQSERFDPKTETWQLMATAHRKRTYHNMAALMPDGRIIIGGHSPINTAYASNINFDSLGLADYQSRDPSFEIYTPPYAMRDDRPAIQSAPTELSTDGGTFTVSVNRGDVDEAMLIRRTATTHLVDGDQRAVVLPITSRSGNTLTLQMTDNPAVLPPGQYMLFVSYEAQDGMRLPSVSAPVTILRNSANEEAIEQPEPAVVENTPQATTVGGLLRGDLSADQLQQLNSGVSPLLPVTDLLSGVTSVIPGPSTLIEGAPETAAELGGAGQRGGSILGDTVTSLPGAATGLLQDLGSAAQQGDTTTSDE
ncbi:galactose oxidase-like domain-containing protein [Salinisphaera aquimarina]|uniref:Galactose oxidase-like domain-containing protein n=1 Tax=Salinisphaera aquimarina TaxID=2094031 RepID=A0ABV7ETU4_9GAMM